MKIKLPYFLMLCIFIQATYSQTKWKQVSGSPFSINTVPAGDNVLNNGPRQVSYSPDGSFLATANAFDSFGTEPSSGSISVFSVNKSTGFLTELENSPFKTNTNGLTISLAFSPTGTPTIASTDRDSDIKIYNFNPNTGNLFNLRSANDGPCIFIGSLIVNYSHDGRFVAADSLNSSVDIYNVDLPTGNLTCQQTFSSPLITFPRSLDYYPLPANPSYLAVTNISDLDNHVIVFTVDPETGFISNPKSFKLREGSQDIITRWIDFSPDGKFVAIAVVDGVEMRRFKTTGINAPALLPLKNSTSFFPTPSDPPPGVRSIDHFSPDGRFLAVANGNDTVSVFCVNKETGVLFNRQDLVVGHTGNFGSSDLTISVDFSPDGKFLAVCNRDDNSVSVFSNPAVACPTCNILLNLSNNESCAECANAAN